MPTCTITKSGRCDEYGRPLQVGQNYEGTSDQVRALVQAGFATLTYAGSLDEPVFSPPQQRSILSASLLSLATFALAGDSRNEQYAQAGGNTLSSVCYFDWFRALSGLNIKTMSFVAKSGSTTAALEDQISRILNATTLPRFTIIWSGVNGYGTYSAAEMYTHVYNACVRLLKVGITPIVFLDTGSTNINSAAALTWLFEYNERLRELSDVDSRIWVYDPTAVIWDGASANWTSTPAVAFQAGYMAAESPTTHTSPAGAYEIGVDFTSWFAARAPKFETRPSTRGEMVNANNPLALIANGMFTTTSGGVAAGTGSLTGNVPGSWNYNKGTRADTSTTITTASNADTYGNDVTFAITCTGADTTKLYQDVASGPRTALNINDLIQGSFDIEVSGGTNLQGVYLFLQATDGTNSTVLYDMYCNAQGAATGNGPQAYGPLTLQSDPLKIAFLPTSWVTLQLFFVFSGAGGATVKVRRAKLRKRFV